MYKTDNSWVKSQMMIEAEMKAADSENKMDGEYMVGAVKCTVQRTKRLLARLKCDDQENF